MRKSIISLVMLLFAAVAVSAQSTKAEPAAPSIVPLPTEMNVTGDVFVLTNDTRIVTEFDEKEIKFVKNALNEIMVEVFGRELKSASKVKPGDGKYILIKKDAAKKCGNEGYTLEINKNGINITAKSAAGAFYAVQTLRQIVPVQAYETPIDLQTLNLPTLKINDNPHFAYRGFMLDCSRHFWSVETIKEMIDILALHKMNRFHWHLTEDQGWRIEIKKYPLLTEIGSKREQTTTGHNVGMDGIPYGGYYSQKDIKEIVKYAQERFITIVPEIEIPGHSLGALSAYPWLGCRGEKGNYKTWSNWGVAPEIVCAGKESSFQFWYDVLEEVLELFPSEYIHIGGDESPRDEWKVCELCQQRIKDNNLKDEAELQSYVTNRIEKFLNERGRKLIGWDEILEGGVSKNATIMSWRGSEGGIKAAKSGNMAIMTPNGHCYFDYYQTTDRKDEHEGIGGYVPLRKVYALNPYEGLNPSEQRYIMGVQANLWTEYIPTPMQLQYQVLPRLGALAEIGWTNPSPENKNVDEFITRAKELSRYYYVFGYNCAKHFFEDGVQEGW